MEEKRILEIAEEEGFVNASVIDTEDIVFIHGFRALCEENDCGNYNKNYGCPPYCGTPQEMEDRVRAYRKAVVFQTKYLVDNAMDGNETKPLKKMHIQMTRSAMKHLEGRGLTYGRLSCYVRSLQLLCCLCTSGGKAMSP